MTLFSPTISTLAKAIENNHFLSWPGIEKLNFTKLSAHSIPTSMGHLNQERKNQQSTKNQSNKPEPTDETECYFPQMKTEKSNMLFSKIQPYAPKLMAYGDLTGQFPYKSLNSNFYIYVLYDYNSNSILVQAIPNRQAWTIAQAWQALTDQLNTNGHKYNNFVLDNEILTDLRKAFSKYHITYECVLPKIHCCNAAERAEQTFKNHFWLE